MTDEIKFSTEDNLDTADQAADKPSNRPRGLSNFGWKMLLAIVTTSAIAVGTARWWMPYFKKESQPELVETNIPFTVNPENDELLPLQKRLAALETQINALQSKPTDTSELHAPDTAKLGEMVYQISAALLKITEFEKRLNRYEQHQQRIIEIYANFDEIKALIDEGKPFAEPLNRFAERTEDFQQFQQPILELAEYAPLGIPTYQQIYAELLSLIETTVASTSPSTEELSGWERIKMSLKDMVHIRKKSDLTATTAANMIEAFRIAKNLLEQNHTAEAVAVLQPFERELPTAGHSLLEHLRARIASDRIVKFFNDLLSSPRFIQLLMIPK